MMPLSDAAAAVFVVWNTFVVGPSGTIPQRLTEQPIKAVQGTYVPSETPTAPHADSSARFVDSTAFARKTLTISRPSALGYLQHWDTLAPTDTVRKARKKAFVYSEAYATRLTIHRRLSWAMLPLFAVSYVTGDRLIKNPSGAPSWARSLHGPAATGSALLFGANSITGYWNLWEGRHDPNGRTRRIIHALLFTAASGGFVYAGTQLANDAEQSQAKRREHRNVAIGSMGLSTASWLIMLIRN